MGGLGRMTERRIYFDVVSGDVLIDTGTGDVIVKTEEQDIATYTELSIRNRDSFDVLKIPPTMYQQDFFECISFRVNTETKKLEFSYPDPNEPKESQPYQQPLSVEVEQLKDRLAMQDATMEELMFIILPEITGGGI